METKKESEAIKIFQWSVPRTDEEEELIKSPFHELNNVKERESIKSKWLKQSKAKQTKKKSVRGMWNAFDELICRIC